MYISKAAIDNLRDNEVFEKAASLIYCLNNSDMNIAGAGAGRVGVGAGPRPPLPYHVFWPAIAGHVTV